MPIVTRRQAIGGMLGLPLAANRTEQSTQRHNVLVLMTDEHNPRYSSVYGHPFVQTPNLKRLASRGTVFENCYVPSPLCRPARSAFMSGRRVHEIQAYNNCNVFTLDFPTYGRMLRDQGVHTVHVGKTDVYDRGAQLGFSEMILPGDREPPGDIAISRNPLAIRRGGEARGEMYGPHENPFSADEALIRAAIDWLERQSNKLGKSGKPWTMVVNIAKPHFPHLVTEDLWDFYKDHADLPRHGVETESASHTYAKDHRQHFQSDRFTTDQIRGLRRGYYGCVTYADRQLGRLMDTVERLGLTESTVIVYTSDHGEMLGTFGMWWKCSLYEDSARVPLVAAGPGFTPGKRVRTPVDLLDLNAAMFHATGALRPAELRGRPLQEIPAVDNERVLFAEYHGHGARGSSYLVRRGRWKLIWYTGAPHQVFDLDRDPGELTNLIDREPEVFRALDAELRAICNPEMENERAESYIGRQIKANAALIERPSQTRNGIRH